MSVDFKTTMESFNTYSWTGAFSLSVRYKSPEGSFTPYQKWDISQISTTTRSSFIRSIVEQLSKIPFQMMEVTASLPKQYDWGVSTAEKEVVVFGFDPAGKFLGLQY